MRLVACHIPSVESLFVLMLWEDAGACLEFFSVVLDDATIIDSAPHTDPGVQASQNKTKQNETKQNKTKQTSSS